MGPRDIHPDNPARVRCRQRYIWKDHPDRKKLKPPAESSELIPCGGDLVPARPGVTVVIAEFHAGRIVCREALSVDLSALRCLKCGAELNC